MSVSLCGVRWSRSMTHSSWPEPSKERKGSSLNSPTSNWALPALGRVKWGHRLWPLTESCYSPIRSGCAPFTAEPLAPHNSPFWIEEMNRAEPIGGGAIRLSSAAQHRNNFRHPTSKKKKKRTGTNWNVLHLNHLSFSCFQWGMHRWKLNTHSLISLTSAIAHLCSEYSRPCPVQTECPFVSRVVFHFEPSLRMTTQSPSKKKAVWTKVE